MKITKYEHACLVVEENGQRLVIDPGAYTTSLPKSLDKVAAIVITHIHQDHYDADHIKNIIEYNPAVQIFGTQEVADELKGVKVNVVTDGSSATVGPFELSFFGSQHAVIHESLPPVNQNVGVMVNSRFYYPGDSFTMPPKPVEVLAVPVAAPWLKLAESIDFLLAIRPKLAFGTHNALMSDSGQSIADRLLSTAHGFGGEYKFLKTGESIEA